MRILLIEDDREAAAYLFKALREAGHVAEHAADGDDGAAMAADGGYDVLIVDRMLPKRDGLSSWGAAQARRQTPVLFLSALGRWTTGSRGCAPAATTTSPSPMPSPSCWRASRRSAPAPRAGRDHVSRRRPRTRPAGHTVTRAGKEIELQPREFRLLEYLMRHAGQVVTRTMLLENVWDYHFDPQTNVIDVHISRLRAKIDKGFGEPLLHTVRGAG